MAVVSVREYKSIQLGEKCDGEAGTVTRAQRDYLERFNEAHQRRFKARPFQYGSKGSLVAQNYVGVIDLGRHQVEVLPKIDVSTSVVRRNLAKMLCVALDVEVHGSDVSAMHQTDSILEVLVRLFCVRLWSALHKGVSSAMSIGTKT